jgi:type I restriction enzyme S subunit
MTAIAAMARATPKAFAVWFKDLERWSVGSFIEMGWRWPRAMIRPLAEALERKSVDVVRQNANADALQLVTLHFTGEMKPRERTGTKPVKGRLSWADPGDVIYSKIDVRNGAIGIVPDELGRVCVTSEYPVYTVDPTIADARYVKLLFRTEIFRRKINSMISGASGRKRVQPTDLESVEVPLPPLEVQRAIVAAWEKTKDEVADTRRRITELEEKIETDFLSALDLSKPERAALPRVFAVWWKDLQRWSVMFNQLASVSADIATGKHLVKTLGEIAEVSYGIQKCPANRPSQHARPYLRVANVQRGELDLREVKKINVPDADMPTYRLEPRDLLVCEGNSADLVGRPAIWRGEIPDCVHQNHILKVRVNHAKALPEYVLEYMHTGPARNHFRSRAKFTTNLASINSNDLRELPLALPPLDVQRELVAKVTTQRQRIAMLKTDADQKAKLAKADMEAMILGDRRVAA